MTLLQPFDFPIRGGESDWQRFVDAMNRATFLERSFVTPVIGQRWQGVSSPNYMRTTTDTFESWYVCGQDNATALATANPAINTLIAVPFVAETEHAWDRIAFEVTTVSGANGRARVGIYAAKVAADGTYYPGPLVVQGSEADVSSGTGSESTTIDYGPTEGALYYAAYLCGTANPTIRTVPVGGLHPAMGLPSTLGTAAQVAYTVASTYSTNGLPSNFPSAATAHTSAVPAISLRHASIPDVESVYPARHFVEDGYALRRAFLISSDDFDIDRSGPTFTVEARIRDGVAVTVLGTYDSAENRIDAGRPFLLTGEDDVDMTISAGSTLEIAVTQRGRPVRDIRGLGIQWDCAYVGGTNG